ncbi:hypothetical protein QYF61_003239 [Mycteria americana]|uniref:Uncharacterized protein n=1 Tax=Mycteria americana TaxID=33587 RepID=A0AAN7NG28_MYCAM|nr:hypothetical protein QYF61_003239 [Mycteria americana]
MVQEGASELRGPGVMKHGNTDESAGGTRAAAPEKWLLKASSNHSHIKNVPPLMKNEGVWDAGSLREERRQMFHRQYKTGRGGSMPDGCAALQRDLGRLEKRANKCKVPCLGRNNPRHQDRLGADRLESSSAEKVLGVL